MLQKLLALFADPNDGSIDLSAEEGREAVAAILVEAARADDDYEQVEREHIDRILATRYGLDGAQAAELRAVGEAAQARATDLVRFTQAVKRAVPHEDRVSVIEAVWEIAYADGDRDHAESALVRRLCGLLYVEDRDAGLARQRVEARQPRP
jgi:uncharacterized tellurite resistance protein B-like protein